MNENSQNQKDVQKFVYRKSGLENETMLKYKLLLHKSKNLYFNGKINRNKRIRKNSEILSHFKIFKIRRKTKINNHRLNKKEYSRPRKQKFENYYKKYSQIIF